MAAQIRRKHFIALGLAVLALVLGAGLWLGQSKGSGGSQRIGLFTTLPILWNESADVADLLKQDQEAPHWARTELTRRGKLVPLDTLAGPKGSAPLDEVDLLVMAQSRPLSPEENVALDDWVKRGGKLLLLADPALTQESAFSIGDPRRPQAVVLLSPILRRWGLEEVFDEDQPYGERVIEVMGVGVPTNLAGRFRTQGQGNCKLWGDGLAVTCALGKGRLVALADAAVLERDDPDGARQAAFSALLDSAAVGR